MNNIKSFVLIIFLLLFLFLLIINTSNKIDEEFLDPDNNVINTGTVIGGSEAIQAMAWNDEFESMIEKMKFLQVMHILLLMMQIISDLQSEVQ